MKANKLFTKLLFLALIVGFTSCSDDDDDIIEELPTEMTADNNWVDGEIEAGEEMWYKVTCDPGATSAMLEWAELDWPRKDESYTGDIAVSVYQMDGITAYFENINDGYKLSDGSTTFDLAGGEEQFLVKVLVGPKSIAGTYAIRANFSSDVAVDYVDLTVGDTWTEATIETDAYKGYKVKCTEGAEYQIIWAEKGTEGFSYTADVKGSVLNKDANQFYAVENGGSGLFQDKNKSYGEGDIKSIIALTGEGNFKIHFKGVEAGNFAVKVIKVTN